MTSTEHRPPLQAVNPAQHDDRAMWQLDRRRFAAFLTAKDLVLGYTRTATEGAGRLAARLHLGGVCTMVRRCYGWLLGAASVAARGLRAPGVLAGLVWALSTDVGQTLVGTAVGAVSTAVSAAAGAVGTAARWTLRLFGSPGARLATWLGSKLAAVTQAATDRVWQLKGLSGLLRSQNLPAKAVGAIARERLLRTLVGRFLPRPWSWLVRIVANIALLPTAVLRDAGTVVVGVVPGMHPSPAPRRKAPHRRPATRRPRTRCRPSCPLRHRQRRARRRHRYPPSRSASPPGTATCSRRPWVGTDPAALPGAQAVGG